MRGTVAKRLRKNARWTGVRKAVLKRAWKATPVTHKAELKRLLARGEAMARQRADNLSMQARPATA